jgi:crotonobetainyl-CoA:carnitine CoA-transferase CaiB-like acyl-CoA transferase
VADVVLRLADVTIPDPASAWAASGAMVLTGRQEGPPLLAPPGVVAGMTRLAFALHQLSDLAIDGPALLGERAALAGLSRQGDVSCGGGARILQAADGWLAVSLARPDDVDALPAWLEDDVTQDQLVGEVRRRQVAPLVVRATMLGLPAAVMGEAAGIPALRATPVAGSCRPKETLAGLTVVDLSSLWAGPLCGQLIRQAGARVIKVESQTRPDGARRGPAAFFDLLHAGQESVALDFRTASGRTALLRLLTTADVVIEASRPRALAQLGARADDVLATGRPRVWVSLTGFGREAPEAGRVAFGDDAAVAGGLVVWDRAGPCFCADAIADPAAGLFAAAAVLSALSHGGRWLLDVALAGVAAFLAGPFASGRFDGRSSDQLTGAPARARVAAGAAAELGHHTSAVLRELGR